MANNNSTEYKLLCEHYREVGVFGGGCNAPEKCPYNPTYQFIHENLKGCNVAGIVPKSDLSEDLRRKLNEGLVHRIKVSYIPPFTRN